MHGRSTLLFIALNLLLTGFYLDTWDNGNTASRMLAVYAKVNTGSFCIDEHHEMTTDKSFIDGHYYSDKAPLPAFLVIPFYKMLRMCGYPAGDRNAVYLLGALVCGVIPFVMLLWLLYREAQRRTAAFPPALLAMLPLYGSFVFIYAGTFYNHVLSALLLLLSYIFMKDKRFMLAGLFAGLAFLTEYIIALVIAVWALQILFNERKLRPVIRFTLGVLPGIALILLYNYIFTGDPFAMLYKFHAFEELHKDYGFSHPTFTSLWGLTFSQYKGLFVYMPFLLIPLFFFAKDAFSRVISLKQAAGNYILSCFVATLLLVSAYFGWWGGWTYGPRLILFAGVLMAYEGIGYISTKTVRPLWIWLTCISGLLITLMAKFTVLYSVPSEVEYPVPELIRGNILPGNFNPNNVLSMLTGSSPATAALVWILLFTASCVILYRAHKHPLHT
jgi:hypothetical protein